VREQQHTQIHTHTYEADRPQAHTHTHKGVEISESYWWA